MGRMWKDVVVFHFKVMPRNFHEWPKEIIKTLRQVAVLSEIRRQHCYNGVKNF